MIMLKNFEPIENYTMGEFEYMRFFTLCHWSKGTISTHEFYKLGDVLESSNPYAYAEEKCCSGHIVRKVGVGISLINVIRDDSTVWAINLECFKSVTPLKVVME